MARTHRGQYASRRSTKPVLRGTVQTNGTGAGLTTTVTVPAAAGDTLVAFALAYQEIPTISNAVVGDTTGWTTVLSTATTQDPRMTVATKTAVAGGNVVTASRAVDGDAIYLIAFALTGPATVDASSTAAGTSGTTLTLPSVATAYANGQVFAAWGAFAFDGAPTFTAPTGGYSIVGTTPSHSFWSMVLAQNSPAAAFTTGAVTPTVSKSASNGWAGLMLAFSKPTKQLQLGVVGYDAGSVSYCGSGSLGAAVVRIEFAITDTLSTVVDPVVAACAANKIKLQPLIGWANGAATPDLTPLSNWASRYGKGGTYWAGGDDTYAITDIELGNENSYPYKSGTVGSAGYNSLATSYGTRALAAAQAINTANSNVKVLVELDDANTNNMAWTDNVLAAGGATLTSLMRAPVLHLYGYDWQTRLSRNYNYLVTKGVTKPYYATEFGIASDDGGTLTDNYGWSVNLTYAQAADLLSTIISQMAATPNRLKQAIVYQWRDNRSHLADNTRDHYFGVTNVSGGDKGAISPTMRAAFTTYR